MAAESKAPAPAAPKRAAPRRTAGVQSFEVGLALLSLLAHQRRPMKITALAAQARMPPAKAHRYLASLVRSGYASQSPDTGLYSTGPAATSCPASAPSPRRSSTIAVAWCSR
jgi:DNA-binding IclR family transcriptional regulator